MPAKARFEPYNPYTERPTDAAPRHSGRRSTGTGANVIARQAK